MSSWPPEYVASRTVLLDALETLEPHGDGLIVVGAQAVYLQTERVTLRGIAPYTTDADLALLPMRMQNPPLIEDLLTGANFRRGVNPGEWWRTLTVDRRTFDVEVNLMVPEEIAGGSGRRSVDMPPHASYVARRTPGLEGVIVDADWMGVRALEPRDTRRFTVQVAGRAALIVAKVVKLSERIAEGRDDRIYDKDASDIYRLMLATPADEFVRRFLPLRANHVAGSVCRQAMDALRQYFGVIRGVGVRMAVRSLEGSEIPERVSRVCTSFVEQVSERLA